MDRPSWCQGSPGLGCHAIYLLRFTGRGPRTSPNLQQHGGYDSLFDVGKLIEGRSGAQDGCAPSPLPPIPPAPWPSRSSTKLVKSRRSWCLKGRWQSAYGRPERASGPSSPPPGGGTETAEGKEHRELNGRMHVLEYPLQADYALLRAYRADKRATCSSAFPPQLQPHHGHGGYHHHCRGGRGLRRGRNIRPDHVHLPSIYVQRMVKIPPEGIWHSAARAN